MKKCFSVFPLILCLILISSLACSSIPFLAPTPTSTPTNTPNPTPTFTPEPTQTQTPTPTSPPPTPTIEPTYPISEEELADGSTLIIDQELGYEFIMPPNWLVINFTSGEYDRLISTLEKEFPEVVDLLDSYGVPPEELFRAIFFDTDPDHIYKASFPTCNIVYTKDPTIKL